jgi:hypothetical protein
MDKHALHTAAMNKQLLPDALSARWRYPFFGDLRLNLWAFLAIGSAVAVRLYLRETPGQSGPWRLAISLIPLVPACLYAFRLDRWMADFDEMQRRIQRDALVFAAMWTVFLRMALDLFHASGAPYSPSLGQGLGVEGTFAAMCALYLLGCVIANRRYR